MKAFLKSFSIDTNTENGREGSTIRIEFVNVGDIFKLHHFLMFLQDKGVLSIETLTSYLIHQKLKESK